MANIFKNSITGSIGVTGVIVYQVPAATTTTVIGVNVANVVAQNISISVTLRDSSASKTVYLVKDAIIVQGSSTILVGGEQKIVMETGDYLTVTSSVGTSADVIVSVLELT